MKRLAWSSLVVACLCVAVVVVGLTWKSRAEDLCRERAPMASSEPSVTWDWEGFAYVCDYRVPSVEPRRVGIIDAFHGDQKRHGLDRRPR